MSNKAIKIKPCPFCGGNAEFFTSSPRVGKLSNGAALPALPVVGHLYCSSCGARTADYATAEQTCLPGTNGPRSREEAVRNERTPSERREKR